MLPIFKPAEGDFLTYDTKLQLKQSFLFISATIPKLLMYPVKCYHQVLCFQPSNESNHVFVSLLSKSGFVVPK